MAKRVKTVVKLQIVAGKATPARMVIPVEITIYEDRSYTFVIKTPPAVDLIKKAISLEKGGATPLRATAGKISKAQVREIATLKLKDLNAYDVDSAMKIIEGTCRSMGVEVVA
jgi:large subunit ribosomal protein L11